MPSCLRSVGPGILALWVVLGLYRAGAAQCQGILCWGSLDGPQSGEVTAIATLPEGAIIAGTAGKGLFYRDFPTTPWVRTSSEAFDGITVRSVVLFGNRLVASTSGKGIWSSLDSGRNWSGLNAGLGSLIVHTLFVASDGRLYAGASSGLYVLSQNDRWVTLQGGAQGHDIRAIAETSGGVLFAGSYGRGILRSTDGGLTWELVGNGLATTIIRTLAVNNSDEVFVGTFGGHVVQRSDDGGDTWVDSGEGLEAQGIWTVAIAPNGTFFAGARSEGIFISLDGRTWESRPSPFTTVSGFAFTGGNVFAATRVGLLSLEGDSEWILEGLPYSRVNALLSLDGRLLAGLHLGGVHYSDDGGQSWTPSSLDNEAILTFAEDGTGGLLAGTLGSGVFRSLDQGESWEQVWRSIRVFNGIDVDADGGILVATDNGIYRLAAADSIWQQLTPPGLATRSVLVTDEGVLLAGSERESIWRSDDNGQTWEQMAPELRGEETWIWDLIKAADGRLVAATISEGIWLSSDDGLTWEPLPGTAKEAIADLGPGYGGDLAAVSFFGQIFLLGQGRSVAETYGPPFVSAPARSIAVTNEGYFFIGTDPLGVQELYAVASAEELPEFAGAGSLSVYPSPTDRVANITLEIATSGLLEWEMVDILGRSRMTGEIVSGAGRPTAFDLDVSHLSPGVYWVRIRGDGVEAVRSVVVAR